MKPSRSAGKNLLLMGVVLVGEHGVYHSNLNGQTYYPRWWVYQQIVRVFEQSKRAVPVFNDTRTAGFPAPTRGRTGRRVKNVSPCSPAWG